MFYFLFGQCRAKFYSTSKYGVKCAYCIRPMFHFGAHQEYNGSRFK